MTEFLDQRGCPREVTKTEVVSAFVQTIQRCLNCLSAEEQRLRKNAIEKLYVCLLEDDGAGSLPPIDILQAAWDEVILGKVLPCVSDPTEKCRELAIRLIRAVAQSLPEVDCTLKDIVRVMAERMGQLPILEESEEIRLQLFSLLIDVLLPKCEIHTLHKIIEPLHLIVAVTLHDHFHEVQKSVCSVLVIMANRDPDVFGSKTGSILKALVPCLTHSHSRVRIAVFQAIDAMVRCGLTATSVAQDLAPGTKSLAFDHATAVREIFFASVANWLNYRERNMTDEEIHECAVAGKVPRFHVPELLPLLLLGITDDCLDIATSAYEKLEGIGEIYKKVIDHLEEIKSDAENSNPADESTPTQDSCPLEEVPDKKVEESDTKLGDMQVVEDPKSHAGELDEEAQKAKDALTNHEKCFEDSYTHLTEKLDRRDEDDLDVRPLSAEQILDTELRRFNECSGTVTEVVKSKDDSPMATCEKKGINGLHILADELPQEQSVLNSSRKAVEKRGTSEVTDEGAVRKATAGRGVETLQLPKPYNGRPGAGCRLMAQAFLRVMIEPALKELKQWTIPTRLSAARLLHTLLILAEETAKDDLDILVPAFCSAVGDDDVKVAKRIVATVHIVGFHVSPEKWLHMLLKPLGCKSTSSAQRANVLVVLSAFLYGTPRNQMEEKYVEKISDTLYGKESCCSDHTAVQNQLLSVLTNLVQVGGALCTSSSFKIFVMLLQLQSVEGDVQLQKRSSQVLEALAQALGMESARDLYVQHIHSVLDIVTAGHEEWSSGLPGKLMFQTFMRNAKDTVGPYLQQLLPVFRVCLQKDQDPALRISFLQLLDELFEKPELESSWARLAPDIIGKLLLPCGVWRASKAHMQEIMKDSEGLLPVVKTCIDEDYFFDVRRATTHVLYQFLRVYGPLLSDEERTKLIKVFTKRMDDSSNTIRLAILPSVAMFFNTMPPSFSGSEVKDFVTFLVAHMDDEHPHIQEGTCRAMEACASKRPRIVMEVLRSIRSQHRNKEYLDRVVCAAESAK